MSKAKEVKHYVHSLCNGCAGFVEVMEDRSMWVVFGGSRMAYSVLQGKLKNTVHSVMVQHSLVSSWRG
ncbi:hypothetical protein CSC04_3227 [Enterobacter roggenkampii]|uniref:hypothetical protein n=1 Tax=Enterobacter roggenkampii TaxID=1812935 RepID=UPI000D40C030|nr:hypothetical protein [Enterobacter roggenkampii]PRW42534.1 hypothetical protein CSC04_3227 [Enterobacter roggenkampii]QLV15237.1 hypothetical protein HV150_10930 [Enterobacter roggenkampii]